MLSKFYYARVQLLDDGMLLPTLSQHFTASRLCAVTNLQTSCVEDFFCAAVRSAVCSKIFKNYHGNFVLLIYPFTIFI